MEDGGSGRGSREKVPCKWNETKHEVGMAEEWGIIWKVGTLESDCWKCTTHAAHMQLDRVCVAGLYLRCTRRVLSRECHGSS